MTEDKSELIAPAGASVLTTEELTELRKLGDGGLDTALEWRAAALAAHPFLLNEVERRRAESAERELESCHSRLSTAEKERDEAREEHRLCTGKLISAAGRIANAEEDADTAERKLRADSSALEKALGALRAVDLAFDYCECCRRRMIQPSHDPEECGAWHAAYAMARAAISGGAHVDVPKAQKEAEK